MNRWMMPLVASVALLGSCGDTSRTMEATLPRPPDEGEGTTAAEALTAADETAEVPPSAPEESVDWGDTSPALREAFRVTGDSMVRDGEQRFPRWIEHEKTGLPFAYVRGGIFELGSSFGEEGRFEDEDPARRVRMTGFYIARIETTYAAWRAGGGREIAGCEDEYPVISVDWFQAREWCADNRFSLPSEAQWEYAASGYANDVFPWGTTKDARICNSLGRSEYDLWTEASPAGAIPTDRSWCGALDMAGNVTEWCLDGWYGNYESIPDGAVDPLRMEDGESREVERVVRGGSYFSDTTDHLRTAYRNSILPTDVGANLGFRVVVGR